jgi:hypothetical protein
MRFKKGQVNTLAPAMIALVLASVLLVFGLIISQSIRDTDVIDQSTTTTITNETVTTVTEAGDNLARFGDRGANSFLAVIVTNSTSGATVPATNYTLSSVGVFSVAGSLYNNSEINITYTYAHGEEAWEGANDTIAGLGTFADFWEIIVLAIVITVVIGLLLVVFGGRGRR